MGSDRAQEILQSVLRTGVDRAHLVERECGDDAALRQRVLALLKAHDESAGQSSAAALPATMDSAPGEPDRAAQETLPYTDAVEQVGTCIGPYRLLQNLGEGGMGTVWVAEQERPVKRRVAIKLIKPGMDSAQVVRRFEAERQALALMDHTNIAKVLDAGTTPHGRPFFVMELVKGVPIAKYCDELHLPIHERLRLFVPICQAIQHAHQKGIIHRDIKPSNVLVCMQDGKPVPKVIDFGVAKALHQKLADRTMYTEIGAVVGTLEYMAPEQAELSALDIDTRADVYALGVLLYELLTGTTPLDRNRLRSAAFTEMLRIIREEEPVKPSTRLTHSKESLASLAAERRTEPAKLSKLVRGELDWIVMKCLEKDRTRRYETANGLARDIDRYLNDEPVEACPPSRGYRIEKFVHRHRVALSTAAAFLVLIVGGAVVSIWQAVRATRAEAMAKDSERQAVTERDVADRARRASVESESKARQAAAAEILARQAEAEQRLHAETQQKFAEENERKARESEAQAQAVLEFVQNKVFAAGRPEGLEGGLGKDVRLRDAIDAAEKVIADSFKNEPLMEAAIRNTLGQTYLYLGEPALASRQHELALALYRAKRAPDHPDTLTTMNDLAAAYSDAGKRQEAIALLEETVKRQQSVLGLHHRDTLASRNNLGEAYRVHAQIDKALALHEVTLELMKQHLGTDDDNTASCMNNLALTYLAVGKSDQALPLLQQAHKYFESKLGADHLYTIQLMDNLARAYRDTGKPDQVIPTLENALRLRRDKLGPDHPDTLRTSGNLALALQNLGNLDEAIPLYEKTLEQMKIKLGRDHLITFNTMGNLAMAYRSAGNLDQAITVFEELLKRRQDTLGADHPDTILTVTNLASAYRLAGKRDQAVPLFERSLAYRRTTLGLDHADTLINTAMLAQVYRESGQIQLALPLFEEAWKRLQLKVPHDHPDLLILQVDFAKALREANRPHEAIPLFESSLEAHNTRLGARHPVTLANRLHLGLAYRDSGNIERALTVVAETAELIKTAAGIDHPDTLAALTHLAETHDTAKDFAQAERIYRELVALQRKKLGDEHAQTLGSMTRLGSNLLRQERHMEAEAILRECFSGRLRNQPDDWTTFHTQSLLGDAIVARARELKTTDPTAASAKLAEASSLLVKSFEGLKQRETKIPAAAKNRLQEIIESLVALYTLWDKPEEAAQWSAKRNSP